MERKNKSFRKLLIFVFLIVLTIFIFKRINKNESSNDEVKDTTSEVIVNNEDIADYVSNLNISDNELIHKFNSNSSKIINLYVYGFRHILQRHSGDYFIDYNNKATLFPAKTTGNQIVDGIQKIILNGDTVKSNNSNIVIEERINLNNSSDNYRLIISRDNKIVTFFRIGKYMNENED